MTLAVKKDFLEEGYLIWPLKENSVEKEQLRTEVRQPGGLMECSGWDRASLAEDRVKRRRDVIGVRDQAPSGYLAFFLSSFTSSVLPLMP